MKRICTICARGGSKGVPNKNILQIAGKPLIAHTILQAKATNLFDAIAVSSDSEVILNIAKTWGVELLINRPEDLASDCAAKLPAIKHAVQAVEEKLGVKFDTMVDLDATSPLRSVEDIVAAVDKLEQSQAPNLITASKARRSPYFNLVELNAEGFVIRSKQLDKAIVRRQDSPKCFDMNASIYVWKKEAFFEPEKVLQDKTILHEMPESRSLDIDSDFDFKVVKFLMEERLGLRSEMKQTIGVK